MFNAFLFNLIQSFPLLAYIIHAHDGYIEEPLKDEDYVLGASPLIKKVLQPNGQWDEYLPSEEHQKGRVETMACTSFGLMNELEILYKKKWNVSENKSDRYTAKLSGTSRRGNLMSRVLDSVRKNDGAVTQNLWKNDVEKFNWDEFYAPIPNDILEAGKSWLSRYELGYEAVYGHSRAIKQALTISPIYCAGFSWYKKGDLYYSIGQPNHVFVIYGYEEGKYWKAFDSYPPYEKKLDWNFKITYPKLIVLNRKGEAFDEKKISRLRDRGYKFVMRTEIFKGGRGQVYQLTDNNELRELSEQEKMDFGINALVKRQDLTGISEALFADLLG